jgi:tetratricopeptide (TPR) repeat protein
VTAFRCEESGFILRDDLERLDRVRAASAAEAVVFYCSRILEVMTRCRLRPFYRPSERMAQNLNLLYHYCALPLTLKRWLDRLRELGNDARHAGRPLTNDDADLAFVILLRWLHWYFCEYPWGDFRAAFTVHKQPLEGLLPGEVARLIDRLDRSDGADGFMASLRLGEQDSLLLLTPVVPAVLAEVLLGRGKLEEAYEVLWSARKRFERDLRLSQLEALYWSRRGSAEGVAGHLHQARQALETLRPGGSPADEETHGILGGVYKRLSELDAAEPSWLRRCHEEYRRGWELSRHANNYLGINAASTALWLGQKEAAHQLAAEVGQSLDALREALRTGEGGPRTLTYWDQVTLAEACLLLGELERSRGLYAEAFARFPEKVADIEVTRKQARRILETMGQGGRSADVLGA